MNAFEKRLKKKIDQGAGDIAEYSQGAVIDVWSRGRRSGTLHLGKTFDFYDLASLTKIIFSASAGIQHFSSFSRELDMPVSRVLPWWKHRAVTPFSLLTHTAGLEWWLPFFKKLKGPMDPEVRWGQMKKLLMRVKPKRRPLAVYSDLDLLMFGAFMEARLEKSLLEIWEDVEERLDLRDIFFHPANHPRYARSRYAPTEFSQGEVHDENTHALGGIAPQSGLFGTVDAVSDWGMKLRAGFLGEDLRFGKPAMVRKFVGRRIPVSRGDWGLGFMKPTRGKASCGPLFSLKSFGHTGFTGTSLWYDPVQDLLAVILSNRVYPTRENKKFVALRPRLHEWICQSL
jgi:CubicO group peptidase (beta-lactamase class C family)